MPALTLLRRAAETVAALMMAALFACFVLQIVVRYTGRATWIAEAAPVLDPVHYGWTLELCLALWVWLVFWGCAFVVRADDHVTFDILRERAGPRMRRAFLWVGALAVGAALWISVAPTWDKFHILRLKRTATLEGVFGDWIRMRDVYAIYMLFLLAVPLRLVWGAWRR